MTDLLPVLSTRTFLNTFRVQVSTNYSYSVKSAEVLVSTDSIHIHINESQWVTLPPTVTVFDVLNAVQNQSKTGPWHSCTLILSPPSNVASPMAAPVDPNEPYDDTVRFLTPGDYVDMGDHRIECEDFDMLSITIMKWMTEMHEIMKLKPNAIHGGVFIIHH